MARKLVSIMRIDYDISDVAPYINWDYFFYAWAMHNKPDAEKAKLRLEAESTLNKLKGQYRTHALFIIADAQSDGDDVLTENHRLPFLRQQQPHSECLCLADFIAPKSSPHSAIDSKDGQQTANSQIGIFATTVDMGLETDFSHDDYQKMMVQLLADRLAEATAERMHEEVRKHYWGYAPDEQLTMHELHVEKFQGIRPAVGYPSLPDTSMNFVIDELIDMRQIGIRLTESGAMKPHASVSGFMFASPKAHYFTLGKIGEDQLEDYAHRRGLPVTVMRKFLLSNL